MKRVLGVLGGVIVLTGLIWFFGYRDTTSPPRFVAEDFSGQDSESALNKLADATVDGGAPGAVVLLQSGQSAFVGVAGTANKKDGAPMPADHPLRIGSISKLYTAAVIHSLIGEDLLALDQRIAEILPADIMEDLHNGPDITVRQLLHHSSGIPDYYDFRHYLFSDWKNQPLTLARTLPVSKRGKPTGVAGEQFEYSNMGYILLGAIAEEISGDELGVLIDQYITQPLGLEQTTYNVKHPVDPSIHGYGTYLRPWADTWNHWEHSGPDAGIMASVSDVAKFFEALFFEDGQLAHIGQAMLAEETASYSDNQRQALGPHILIGSDGLRLIGHSGDVFGYQTVAFAAPDRDYIFVGHINCDCDTLSGSLIGNMVRMEAGLSGR
jgi:D-alanyl-D-alanine carboxypeptidase